MLVTYAQMSFPVGPKSGVVNINIPQTAKGREIHSR